MKFLATLFTGLVALLHFGFMFVEMFLWKHPIGYKMFSTTAEFAANTTFMAQNQGLYNGFLVAGLRHCGRYLWRGHGETNYLCRSGRSCYFGIRIYAVGKEELV